MAMDTTTKKKVLVLSLVTLGLALMLGFVIYYRIYMSREESSQERDESMSLSIPDADNPSLPSSKSEAYRQASGKGRVSYEDYFDSLMVVDQVDRTGSTEKDFTPESVLGVESSVSGYEPSSPVPASVASSRGSSSAYGSGAGIKPRTREEQLAQDREVVQMVAQMAGISENSPGQDDKIMKDTKEQRTAPVLPLGDDPDSIISSLDDTTDIGIVHYGDEARPVRCAFLRDEKLVTGQRVSLRLIDKLPLGDITIPPNTRLMATCTIGERLFLEVSSFEYAGKIMRFGYRAYDKDGSIGIYCPETGTSKNSKTIKDEGVNLVSSTLGGVLGSQARSVVRAGANLISSSTGEDKVSVTAGYEFYLFKDPDND